MCTREGVTVDGLKTPIPGRGGGSFSNTSIFKKKANAEIIGNLGNIMLRALIDININDEIFVFYTQKYLK